MNKTLLFAAIGVFLMAGFVSAQTRELTTRSGAENQQTTKLSAVNAGGSEMKPQSRGGNGSDCQSRIHYKYVVKSLLDEKTAELVVKVLGGDSRTFKYPFAKSEIMENGILYVHSDNGMLILDLCGVYMVEQRGQTVELWIARED